MTERAELNPLVAATFLTAGNAVLTLENPKTRRHFTYKVTAKDPKAGPWWVRVLTGPDNQTDYSYMGTIFKLDEGLVLTSKSMLPPDARSVAAFRWMLARLVAFQSLEPARLYHEGRCGRCGRSLTVPESIRTGLGPVCAEYGS